MDKISDIGQHFITGLSSTELSSSEKEIISELSPLGIIIFANNISDSDDWQEKLRSLILEAKELSGRSDFIVSVDHEGGKVHRLPSPSTCFPEGCCWKEKSSDVANCMGKELSELGFNLNFAPVLDIHSEEKNPVIGKRALGTSAKEVSEYGAKFYKALEAENIKACGKHFPGHGATVTDSHLELPFLELAEDELLKRELIPFKKLIKEGLKMIMTAHVVYKKIDSLNPATLSPKIINEILRKGLGFNGLVITDALEMKAMDQDKRADNAIRALRASVDLLLIGQDKESSPLEVSLSIAKGIQKALSESPELKNKILESRKRIKEYLKELPNNIENCSPQPKNFLGCQRHTELAAELKSS